MPLFGVVLFWGLVAGNFGATVTVYEESNPSYWSPEVPIYSDARQKGLEARRNQVLKEFQDYGVPPEVIMSYVPQNKPSGQTRGTVNAGSETQDETSTFDPWSIVWYIGSFGGLIAFFLVVSCSEWCCARGRNSSRTNSSPTAGGSGQGASRTRHNTSQTVGTPPPAYHLFAPPAYDSIAYEEKTDRFEVYVVPVHAMSVEFVERHQDTADHTTEIAPPSYTSLDMPPT